MKEHFIAINEFNAEKHHQTPNGTSASSDENVKSETTATAVDVAEEKTTAESVGTTATTTSEEEAEALKLKEALEVARQNFYKGKVSLVCLSKHGEGYVVKEMQNQPLNTSVDPSLIKTTLDTSTSNLDTSITTTTTSNTGADAAPKINIEDVDASTTRDGKFLLFF